MSSPSESSTPVPAGHRVVGRIVALWRFPVKSMAGEPLESIEASWNGFAGDRALRSWLAPSRRRSSATSS